MTPGDRIGPYEVVGLVGSGGMGEVYRARDPKLNRDVAIKILPEALAADAVALARFEREAQAVAALSHPNILSIFDFGVERGTPYAVMELLDGQTLRDQMGGAAVAPRKAVEYALQIAAGLGAVHARGITHRDLKPENVFVTRDGHVKILDFGLARQRVAAVAETTVAATRNLETGQGTVLGTVGYMAPEQLRGQQVDHRADIFAFGAVLYELLSGRRAFQGTTLADTISAILKEDPPELATATVHIPPSLDRIVRRCLEKNPDERFQSARDVAFALEAISGAGSGSGAAVAPAASTRMGSRRWMIAAAVLVVAALLGAGGLALYRAGRQAERTATAGIGFRPMSFRPQAIFQAAFMPDGETIVYSAALEGNVPELFEIRPEYQEPRPLGLPRTHLLSISSKGEMAVLTNARFVRQRLFIGTLARVSIGSTAPREILEDVRQADWSPDGSDLAIIRMVDGKDRLEFPKGNVLYETAGYLSDLRVSPRGDQIALFEHPRQWDDRGSVIVVDRSGTRTVLSRDYWGVEGLTWSQTGDEVLFTGSTAGAAQTVYGVDLTGHRRVALSSAGGLTIHDISRTGRWLVTRDDLRYEISVLAPGARAERDLSWLDSSSLPYFSRDGSMLLFTDQSLTAGLNYLVCLRKTDGGPVVSLGEGTPYGFSTDGKWALVVIDTPPQIVAYPIGPGETRRLPRGNFEAYQSASWFPDGKRILVCGNEPGKASRCYAQALSGGPPRPITPEATTYGLVAPDGLRILYSKTGGAYFIQRSEGGTAQAVPGLTADDQVIQWSADGRSVYAYRPTNVPFRIERLDLASGRRELVREVAPADRTGVLYSAGAALTDDAKSYAYDFKRMTSQLFVVEGAK